MLISEVCSKVGMTRKSIRYYESEGLLNPDRNVKNDYRVYSIEDVTRLRVIKFLRELNVPISDIRKIYNNELSLEDCMKDSIKKIDRSLEDHAKIKNMCIEIINNHEDINTLGQFNYLEEMNILNKKGITIREMNTNNKKKIIGACLSALLFSVFFIFLVVIISYFQFTESDKMPWLLYAFLMFILGVPILGALYNLVIRIKEIKGGEEDEASKY